MNCPKLANWVSETAYRHFADAWHDLNVDSEEYMRAATRANFLKGFALFLGETNYSYYDRAENEVNGDCE